MNDKSVPEQANPHAKKPRSKKPILKIVLDTNQLFTGSASDLLQLALRQLIEASRKHKDIEIEWHVPEIVRSEREYQMTAAAIELLPTIGKLERLLGHNLGINPDILASRVREAIEKQVRDLDLRILPLNEKEIDWPQVVKDAIFRKPPFEKGKTEKGFRDKLIAESFLQLTRSSPKTPSVCRIALVTADGLLATTVETEAKTFENVRIVKSLEDLQGLINTLVSSATEEFVAAVRKPAEELFFKEGSKDGLYYSGKVRETIGGKFSAQLLERPSNADLRENGTWFIGAPSFVEKHGQRISWKTTVRVDATAFKYEQQNVISLPVGVPAPPLSLGSQGIQITSQGTFIGGSTPASSQMGAYIPRTGLGGLSSYQTILGSPPSEKVQIAKGHSSFLVTWTVTITANRKLINAKVEKVEFARTVWE